MCANCDPVRAVIASYVPGTGVPGTGLLLCFFSISYFAYAMQRMKEIDMGQSGNAIRGHELEISMITRAKVGRTPNSG